MVGWIHVFVRVCCVQKRFRRTCLGGRVYLVRRVCCLLPYVTVILSPAVLRGTTINSEQISNYATATKTELLMRHTLVPDSI